MTVLEARRRVKKREQRVRVIKTIAITMMIVSVLMIASIVESTYTKEGVVVSTAGNKVTVLDDIGHEWVAIDNDVVVGQRVSMKMSTNHTDNIITDDIVISELKVIE